MNIFVLPDLGEGLGEAEIVEWLVQPGDTVAAGAPVVLVETDKAQVEVTSPRSGRVARLCEEAGTRITVGAALLEFEGPAAAEDPGPNDAPAQAREDAGTVVGELPRTPVFDAGTPGPLRAAPSVRALAREHEVDLARIAGTGPGGSISSDDVVRAAASAAADFEPLHGVRLAMARNMSRTHEVVRASVSDEADVDQWVDAKDITARLVRAIASACAAEPALNSWFDGVRLRRRLHARVDLALAVQTKDGLFAPVLRDAARLDAAALRTAIDDLQAAASARSLGPADLRNATITLSNFGSVGGRHASLVIVPPQVAILGAGRIDVRVVAPEGQPVPHRILPLSLTFDHRAVTGAEAARFLAAAIEDLEQPS